LKPTLRQEDYVLGKFSARALRRNIVLIVGMICVTSPTLRAECINLAGSPICLSLEGAGVVFLADVEGVRFIEDGQTFRTEVRFRVLEAIKGAVAGERTLQFVTTVEDFRFERGQRVLLFARPSQGAWSTQCSRTRLSHTGDPELKLLRSLMSGAPGGFVEGDLVRMDGDRVITNRHPDFRVTLRPEPGRGPAQSVATNGAGHFQFDWVSPGAYTLVLDGGASFQDEQRELTVRSGEKCLTLPMFVLRSR
jgi:hypothetical protein